MSAGAAGPVVILSGEADLWSAGRLGELLTVQLATGVERLRVDVSGLSFIDSASMRALVLAARALRERAGVLVAAVPSAGDGPAAGVVYCRLRWVTCPGQASTRHSQPYALSRARALRVLLRVRPREYFALCGKPVRMSGFKNFIMRGNLIELAVAVVIGTQFSNLVKQFVSSFVNPLLSLVGGTPNFGNLTFKAGKAVFTYGQFVTAALAFLISALVVYFILVLPVSRLLQLLERNKAATTRDCPECTMSIPVAARRCPQCTAEITAATERPQPVRLAQPAG